MGGVGVAVGVAVAAVGVVGVVVGVVGVVGVLEWGVEGESGTEA